MREILFLFVLVIQGSLFAQHIEVKEMLQKADSSQFHLIKLVDGNSLIGNVTSVSEDSFKLKSSDGTVTVFFLDVITAEVIDASLIRQGQYWFPDPNRTRLFFAPTGRMLEQSEGYYQNIFLFVHGISYAVSDYITLNAGASIVPSEDFGEENLFYFIPKFGINLNDHFSLATGIMFFAFGSSDEAYDLFYGTTTLENTSASLTVGAAISLTESNRERDKVYTIGGDLRLGKNVSLVTESWLAFDSAGLNEGSFTAYGVRIFGAKHSVDLALITLYDPEIPLHFPFIDYTYNF